VFWLTSDHYCCAQPSQDEDIRKINELRGTFNYYDDFESVKSVSEEIIRLSKKSNRLDFELEAIYTLCWSANYHKKMKDFQSFILWGDQIIARYDDELKRVDTDGYHRGSMILAGGQYYYALGNYERAIEEFSKIYGVDDNPVTRDTSLLNSCYNYIGQSYFKAGNLDKSIQYFELANRYLNKYSKDYDYSQALYYMYQAQYQYSVGKLQDAFHSLQQALPLLLKDKRKAYTRNSLKSNYMLNASFYMQLSEYDSAISYSQKSIGLYKQNDPDFIIAFRVMGDIYYRRHNMDSGLHYYSKSLVLANEIFKGQHYYKSRSLMGIGNIWRDRKDFIKAEQYYQESLNNLMSGPKSMEVSRLSLDNLSTFLLPQEGMQVMIEQAKLYYDRYQSTSDPELLENCISVLNNALFLNDMSRRELMNIETKESRALMQSEITNLGVEVASRAFEITGNDSYLSKAFYFMEKSKGNILMDRIDDLRARKFAGIPKPVLEEELRVKGELSINKDQLLKLKSSDRQYTQIKSQFDDKLREYTGLLSEMEEKYPGYYKLKYDVNTVGIDEIQSLLPSTHSLLLQYYIGSNKIYIAGITKSQVILKIISHNKSFDHNVELILKQIGNPSLLEIENDPLFFKKFVQASRYLFIQLLAPVLDEVRSNLKELIIIPDGFLCYLPFEILLTRDFEFESPAFADLPYVLNEYEVRYDYSASLISENIDRDTRTRHIYVGYAPSYISSSLYANREEVESCSKLWNGTSFLDNRATETAFRNLPENTSILHLAAHSFLNDANPQNSSFALYPDELHQDDGHLYTYELYDMTLPAGLVILSGCETGIGDYKKGEGIISLARAFKFAGCRNIIMSLWKVNDRATKEIMIRFNKNLRKGMEKDRALRLAKIFYLKNSGNVHPAFWSSFVLIGNDSPLRRNKNRSAIVGALCFFIIILFFTYRKSRLFHR